MQGAMFLLEFQYRHPIREPPRMRFRVGILETFLAGDAVPAFRQNGDPEFDFDFIGEDGSRSFHRLSYLLGRSESNQSQPTYLSRKRRS